MINKLKQLLSFSRGAAETDHCGLPKLSVRIPMPTVKPCKPAAQEQDTTLHKDVSEPVLSFLRVFEENPKRFKVTEKYAYGKVIYEMFDTHSKES